VTVLNTAAWAVFAAAVVVYTAAAAAMALSHHRGVCRNPGPLMTALSSSVVTGTVAAILGTTTHSFAVSFPPLMLERTMIR